MVWRELLQTEKQTCTLPWIGGRTLRTPERAFRLEGELPAEHGWHSFQVDGRRAKFHGAAERPHTAFRERVVGYLIGDRLVRDDIQVGPRLDQLTQSCERIHLIEPGLDRFARVAAGRFYEGGPLIYDAVEMPLGPEEEVLRVFLDGAESTAAVPGVCPALDATFRIEVWRRTEAARRREERAEMTAREAEQRAREERRRQVAEQVGTARGRRALVHYDFEEAARAALSLSGAEYLDHQNGVSWDEVRVRFRCLGRRFSCICDRSTLRIIDAGICLTDHETGIRGDGRFTLESLPSVIREAEDEGVLVVFREA